MKNLCSACIFFIALALPVPLLAASVTGTVTDETTGKPAGGDTVALLSTARGLQEITHATTGADGRFRLPVSGGGVQLLRVDHGKVSYFTQVPANASDVRLKVYDAVPSVSGVKVEDDVIHIEADRQAVHIVESYFVKNASSPPRTLFSNQGFVVALPADAQPQQANATDGAGVTQMITPTAEGNSGRYSMVYPLRPGETQFQVAYTIPWTGSLNFRSTVLLPTDDLAVMLPNSMKFSGGAFQTLDQDPTYQTFLLRGVRRDTPVSFAISGTGAFPAEGQSAQNATDDSAAGSGNGAPGGGLGAPIDTPDPLQKYKWMIVSGMAVFLAGAAGFLMRPKKRNRVAPGRISQRAIPLRSAAQPEEKATIPPRAADGTRPGPLLDALREELFRLETDRIEGRLEEAEYAQAKLALDRLLQRALEEEAAVIHR